MTLQQPFEFAVWAALAFVAGTTMMILSTLLMRIIKTTRSRKSEHIGAEFRKDLNNLVLQQVYSGGVNPSSALQFQLDELASKIDGSGIHKQILIDHLIVQRENLSGNASDFLSQVYARLDLHRFSMRKLKSLRWKIRAQGIHELASLNYKEAMSDIRNACQAGKTMRDNILVSLVRLDERKELSFLDNYRGALTDWMQLNIHHCLRDIDPRELPEFGRWFHSHNISVAIFAINMSGIFRQSTSIPGLTGLLVHSNDKVVEAAIDALEALEAHESVDTLLSVADQRWTSNKVIARLVRCVGKLVMPGNGFTLLRRFLDHDAYEVRFEAVNAICGLGPAQVMEMEEFNSARGNIYSAMLQHVTEPLLI